MKVTRTDTEAGQGLIEYAVLFGAIGLAAIMILVLLGVNLSVVYCTAMNGLGFGSAPTCTPAVTVDTPQQDTAAVWADDFSQAGGGSGGWNYNGKKAWSVSNEQMCGAADDGTGTTNMFADGTNDKNYVINASATLNKGDGYGIYFRASGSSAPPTGQTFLNGYTFQYDPGLDGKFVIRKWVNGKELNPVLASADPPKGFQWTGVEHKISLAIHGNSFIASVDGQVLLKVQDSTYDEGYVGLRLWDSTNVCFNDVSVSHGNGNK